MLITLKKNVGLHILDGIVKTLVDKRLEVYVMRRRRPFLVAVFGEIDFDIFSLFGVESAERDAEFFREHRHEFEDARSYLSAA